MEFIASRITKIQKTTLTNETKEELQGLEKEMDKLLSMEERYLQQRSRIKWLNYGDKNTKLFRATTVQRWRTNTIRRLKGENVQWIEDDFGLKEHIVKHFDEHFKEVITNKSSEAIDLFERRVTKAMNKEPE
ncbi:hypothetical protein V6N12_002947 [Hibiscus sabdariffa]|uniref:Uncharacterized protein n=1 Tax=Hibiscus sabdariffa TaxID=183260 RepID=A0ABR2EAG3_9ROSI